MCALDGHFPALKNMPTFCKLFFTPKVHVSVEETGYVI
jgi:hypothetical protein